MRRRAGRFAEGLVVAGCGCLLTGGFLVARDATRDPAARATRIGEVPSAASRSPERGRHATSAPPDRPPPAAPAAAAGGRPGPAPVVPAELVLPGASAPVVPVGVGPDRALALPASPNEVGWWTSGALAGADAGTTLIAGHVDSARSGPGVMARLLDVRVGDIVAVRGADGTERRYRIQARRHYGKASLPDDLFRTHGTPQLALVTCGGRFDEDTGHYDDNVVVYAVPVA